MKKLFLIITLVIGLTQVSNADEAVFDTSVICVEQVERIQACESTLNYCGTAYRAGTSVYELCQSINSEREDQLQEISVYLENAEAALANPLRNPWFVIPLSLLVGGGLGVWVSR